MNEKNQNIGPDLEKESDVAKQLPPIPPQQTMGQPITQPFDDNAPAPPYMEQQPRPYSTMSPYRQTVGQSPFAPPPKDPKKSMAIASMILGIVSVVLSCIIYISVPCGIIAIVLGCLSVKSIGKPMAITGIVLGTIGTLFSIILIVLIFVMGFASQALTEIMPYI